MTQAQGNCGLHYAAGYGRKESDSFLRVLSYAKLTFNDTLYDIQTTAAAAAATTTTTTDTNTGTNTDTCIDCESATECDIDTDTCTNTY